MRAISADYEGLRVGIAADDKSSARINLAMQQVLADSPIVGATHLAVVVALPLVDPAFELILLRDGQFSVRPRHQRPQLSTAHMLAPFALGAESGLCEQLFSGCPAAFKRLTLSRFSEGKFKLRHYLSVIQFDSFPGLSRL
jgi:hypothetical protein